MIHNKQMPWRMAQIRKSIVPYITVPLVWWSVFFDTFDEVMYGQDPATRVK